MIKVYGKPIRVNKASQDKKQMDVGANLFIGNLDPDCDEKVCLPILTPMYAAFSSLSCIFLAAQAVFQCVWFLMSYQEVAASFRLRAQCQRACIYFKQSQT